MIDLIRIYAWTIPAGAIMGMALALLGCQIAARERALQTFCISQSALLGALFGLGLTTLTEHRDPGIHVLPLFFSFLLSVLVFWFTEHWANRIFTAKSTFFASVFAFLLSITYLVSVVFPALESHMANMFFGDLSTLTDFDSKLTFATGALAVFLLWIRSKTNTSRSFDMAIYGERGAHAAVERDHLFLILAILLLCFGVQFLGFLFTISLLFIPTTIFSLNVGSGAKPHFLRVGSTAFLGVVAGFLMTLLITRLPTTPIICLTLTLLASTWAAWKYRR